MNNFYSLYSNFNQYSNDWRDRYQRDRYYNSSNRRIFEPFLSEEIAAQGFAPYYPDGRRFAVCISHDIDHLFHRQSRSRRLMNMTKAITKARFQQAGVAARSIIKESVHPEFDLRRLVDLNNSYKIKSSYYFLSLTPGEEDYAYSLAEIKDQIQVVRSNGNEIGLHGGHRAYNDLEKLKSEKIKLEATLGSPVVGYRNHYLRLELPLTWQNLADAGFSYDTTYGYADCAGFRNGMCYPHFPLDPLTGRFLDIVELPLVVMDATLFYYMRFDTAGSVRLCRQLAERTSKCGGVFTLLWHNNSLSGELGKTYKSILDMLSEMDPWFTTSESLVSWWREKGLLKRSHQIVESLIK